MEGTLGRFRQGLCRLWILIEGWAVAGAVLVLCYQTLVWLRSGSWPDVSARVAWTALGGGYPPVMPWRDVELAVIWLMALPLSLTMIVLGGLMAVVSAVIGSSE